jgi:hypothetical protein
MIIKPPSPVSYLLEQSVFLAGSIEMGTAVDWQTSTADKLVQRGFAVFNPRRDDWDSSWEQSIENPKFVEQVEWELSAIELADIILFYFHPDTLSPISLMELGIALSRPFCDIFVVCPDGFWRKGNIDVLCKWYGIPQFPTIDDAIDKMAVQ